MHPFLPPEIVGEIAGNVAGLDWVVRHLPDEREHHIEHGADLKGPDTVVAAGELKIEASLGIEAGSEGGLQDAGKHSRAADDIVEIVLLGIVAHNFGKSGVVIEHLHIVGDADADGGAAGKVPAHLDATPVGLLVQRALVAIAAVQEKQGVQLAVATGTHSRVERVDGTYRFGMLVVEELHLPVVLVEQVGGAPVLETDPEAGSVRHQLEVPLLEGDIVVIFTHLLRLSAERDCQQCKNQRQQPEAVRIQRPHLTTTLLLDYRTGGIALIMAVGSTLFLGLTSRKKKQAAKKEASQYNNLFHFRYYF